jgi:hypothetical protein
MSTPFYSSMRTGWRTIRTAQGNPTADIVRISYAGRNDALGIEGTATQLPQLTGLPVSVRELTDHEVSVSNGELDFKDRVLIFYTPVLATDEIVFQSEQYEVYRVRTFPGDARTVVTAKRIG